MKFRGVVFLFLLGNLILSACTSQPDQARPIQLTPGYGGCATPVGGKFTTCKVGDFANPIPTQDLLIDPKPEVPAQTDSQGNITVQVKPLNLNNPGDTLDFEVILDTHSVDLSMDLAPMATLSNDFNWGVQAIQWDAPRGGHHVTGKLSFPAKYDGDSMLVAMARVTITIKDLDVPERLFTWQLGN